MGMCYLGRFSELLTLLHKYQLATVTWYFVIKDKDIEYELMN